MSFSDTLIGVNSAALNTPLNHIIWLNDYKTYGENSYVFKDKRILKELYASPIAANDNAIYDDAYSYNKSTMSKDDFVSWYKKGYNKPIASDYLLKILLYGDFGTWSEEELCTLLDAHYNDEFDIGDWVSVGDTRSITLSAMDAVGVSESYTRYTHTFAVADLNHDTLTTAIGGRTKAAITLAPTLKRSIGGYMNSTRTNVGGWASCARRTWCNNIFYNAIPDSFRNMVKKVNKRTSAGNQSSTINTTSDYAFLFSEIEMVGASVQSYSGEGYQYPYFAEPVNVLNTSGWMRSPDKNSATSFCAVNSDGTAFPAFAEFTSSSFNISPGFCI